MAALLQKLKLTDATRAEPRDAPEIRLRRKLLDAIAEEIETGGRAAGRALHQARAALRPGRRHGGMGQA